MNSKTLKKMKMNMLRFFAASMFASVFFLLSCEDREKNDGREPYDPSKPVVLTSFFPDSGRIAEKVILNGANFGSDPGKIRVYFNAKQAKVIGAKGSTMYAICPRTPGDTCDISVVIGNDSLVYPQKFRYQISVSVSTIAGNGSNDFIPGPLASSAIRSDGLCIDDDNNLFAAKRDDNPRFMRINEEEDILTDIVADIQCESPAVNRQTGIVYFSSDGEHNTYYSCDPKEGWAPRARVWTWKAGTGNTPTDTWKKAVAFSYTEDKLYVLHYNGHLVKIDPETNEGEVVMILPQGDCFGMAFHPLKPELLYMCFYGNSGVNANAICTLDVADPVGTFKKLNANAPTVGGHRDGDLIDARFNNPFQLFFDPDDGTCYIADRNNHCIRKITPEGNVETVLGIPGISGFKDGGKEDALFDQPTGIAVSKDGSVYVSDHNNYRVRKLAIE
jgi:hypothetical protein